MKKQIAKIQELMFFAQGASVASQESKGVSEGFGYISVNLSNIANELMELAGITRPEDERKAELMSRPIETLEFTVRTDNCLKAEGIYTVGDLAGTTKGDLLKCPNLGRKSLREIKDALTVLGLEMKE
jgi:DNA-directed RNA polymerase alpha subunit